RPVALVDQSAIPASEFRIIRAYAFIWIAGRIWALAVLFWATIPVSLSYMKDLDRVIKAGYATNPANFIDAMVLATIVLVPTIAGLVLWLRGFFAREGS
ncbi:MAG: hypothetical protein JO210_13130, partial [Acidobacteriaceae bacterium]|nr:hypothetical protein [Acidobacteriaceae bacterium]